ncbi:MAG: Ultraviolet N-glycosylase/AP lyase [Syntrophorhabdus sp. PtaB.Bin184]|jgi:endonuclease-3|nr:MAG: Ultraviolet N-glycosylase/AP lyase [Syntrophorhabdus sp. PtaB.Bin184]
MKKDVDSILNKLQEMHGEPRVELSYANPLELTVATVLSAQCTDERVNMVTKDLFRKYTKVEDYLNVPESELEEDIRPTGFYRNKAKSIKSIAGELLERFGGTVPDDIDTFATVKGIGRKSANMIVGLAYSKPGVIVDTHVARVSVRLGLTANRDPGKIEVDLKRVVPMPWWMAFSLLAILHGRYLCKARKPDCPRCSLREDCDHYSMGGG